MSKIISLPDSFMKILENVRCVFTEPSFSFFTDYIKGILISPKKAVTSFFLLSDRIKHFTDYHRFLYHYKWEPAHLSKALLYTLIRMLNLKELLIGVDDTLVPKYGKRIWGRGVHFDHAAKVNLAQYIKGHNWVTAGLIHHISVLNKWICFPFMTELFVPQSVVSSTKQFKTKIDITIDMFKRIQETVFVLPITLVADALYAKRKLIRWCREAHITMISRLRSDAALFCPLNTSRRRKKRGRPPVKGKRLAKLARLAKQKEYFSSLTLMLYGKEKTVAYREILAYWKPAAAVIKVVIVEYPQKRKTVTSYFFCTDLSRPVASIITAVAARWSLENAFKDMKQHLGFGQWQCWSERAVTRSVPVTCAAYSTLMLWSQQQVLQFAPTLWDAVPWHSHKETVSISDVLYQLKCQCITKSISSILPDDRFSKQKIQQVSEVLRLAA